MNQNPTPRRWSPMVSAPEDEFANFLDFSDLNFQNFDATSQADGGLRQDAAGAMDTSLEGAAGLLGLQSGHMPQLGHSNQIPMNTYQDPFPDMSMEAELFSQQRQRQAPMQMQSQHYHHPNMVPPTPQSMEMHGNQIQYFQPQMDPQQQQMFEQHYRRHQKNQVRARSPFCAEKSLMEMQMNFTPLVSPAVTPLDTQFQYPDYAASADSLSPLTSPALRAQNHAVHNSVYGAVRGSDTSDTTSPVDLTQDYMGPTSGSTPGSIRKSRRNTSSSTKNPARAVRQSPAMKPQRKKQGSSTVIPAKEVAGIIEQARKRKGTGSSLSDAEGKLPLPYSQDSSGADSVSPEPLTEVLMPPPATPRSNSAGRSPYLTAKQNGHQASPVPDLNGEPATPSSLMRIRQQKAAKPGSLQCTNSQLKEQAMLAEADMEQIMENIALPEPANPTRRPSLKPIDTAHANADLTTPVASAPRTPGPISASVTATGSAFPSPSLSAMASPNGLGRRGNLKLKVRDPKKRNSNNSGKPSPALRPKISPSIKPLLPEGSKLSPLPIPLPVSVPPILNLTQLSF